MSLSCERCGHVWNGHVIDPRLLPVPAKTAVAVITKMKCPRCEAGSDHIRIEQGAEHVLGLPEQVFNVAEGRWEPFNPMEPLT